MDSSNEDRGSIVFLMQAVFVAALGGLLFGYDTAVISGAIGFLQEHFELSAAMKGWAASSALVGCVIGVALAGEMSDRLGRRTTLIVAAVFFLVSAIGSALPKTRWRAAWSISRVAQYRCGGIKLAITSLDVRSFGRDITCSAARWTRSPIDSYMSIT